MGGKGSELHVAKKVASSTFGYLMPFGVVKILSVSSGAEDFQIENAKHRGQIRAGAIILVLDLVQPLDDPTIFAHIFYAYFMCLRFFVSPFWPFYGLKVKRKQPSGQFSCRSRCTHK